MASTVIGREEPITGQDAYRQNLSQDNGPQLSPTVKEHGR